MNRSAARIVNVNREFTFTEIINEACRINAPELPTGTTRRMPARLHPPAFPTSRLKNLDRWTAAEAPCLGRTAYRSDIDHAVTHHAAVRFFHEIDVTNPS
jgi:hypothetical protein